MKIKFLILLIPILLLSNFTFSQDTIPENVVKEKQISDLENKISNLEYKITTLENSNDRIFNALYVTIGIVLTFFIGLNLYNYFVQNRNYSKKIETELQERKDELEKKFSDRLSNISNSIDNSIEYKLKSIKSDIIELKLSNYDSHSKFIDYERNTEELEYIKKFIEASIEYYDLYKFGDYKIKRGLIALQEYLEKEEYVYHSTADEFLKYLSSDKFIEFKRYTDKIIPLLKEK